MDLELEAVPMPTSVSQTQPELGKYFLPADDSFPTSSLEPSRDPKEWPGH